MESRSFPKARDEFGRDLGYQYFCGFAPRGTEKLQGLTIFRGTCLDWIGISVFREQFGRDRDSTICPGAVWTGTELPFLIIPSPVNSRGENPED
ncbi:unnamed protein product [Laminaria digitata]